MIQQAKEKKARKKEKLQKEDFLHQVAQVWDEKIIPNFDFFRSQKEAQRLWAKYGLPPKHRGKIWMLAIGNALHVNKDLFAILKNKKVESLTDDPEELKDDKGDVRYNRENSIHLIKLDLSRTFPHLQIFQEGGPYYEPFREVLECYVKYRPDVGYVRGYLIFFNTHVNRCRACPFW